MGVRLDSLMMMMMINHSFMNRPTDDGTKMEAPGVLVNVALDYGVTHVSDFSSKTSM